MRSFVFGTDGIGTSWSHFGDVASMFTCDRSRTVLMV